MKVFLISLVYQKLRQSLGFKANEFDGLTMAWLAGKSEVMVLSKLDRIGSAIQWQIQDAKNRFSALVKAAEQEGPQVIAVHGKKKAVLLSAKA